MLVRGIATVITMIMRESIGIMTTDGITVDGTVAIGGAAGITGGQVRAIVRAHAITFHVATRRVIGVSVCAYPQYFTAQATM